MDLLLSHKEEESFSQIMVDFVINFTLFLVVELNISICFSFNPTITKVNKMPSSYAVIVLDVLNNISITITKHISVSVGGEV